VRSARPPLPSEQEVRGQDVARSAHLTISFPVTLGLSGHSYYEFGTTKNPAFGYVQLGPVFSVPLGCIPKSFGTWTVKGAAEFLFLGETLKALHDNDSFKPIGRIGIAAVY
jgi:hypothetical protein